MSYNVPHAAINPGSQVGRVRGGCVERWSINTRPQDHRQPRECSHGVAGVIAERLVHRDSLGEPAGFAGLHRRHVVFQLLLPTAFRYFHDCRH
jgi:hypothetical protein